MRAIAILLALASPAAADASFSTGSASARDGETCSGRRWSAPVLAPLDGDAPDSLRAGDREVAKLPGALPRLDLTPARGPRFDANVDRFKRWLVAWQEGVDRAQKRYQEAFRDPRWRAVAARRIGTLFLAFARVFRDAPVSAYRMPPPTGMQPNEWKKLFRDTYCEQLDERAEQLEAKAREAFAAAAN